MNGRGLLLLLDRLSLLQSSPAFLLCWDFPLLLLFLLFLLLALLATSGADFGPFEHLGGRRAGLRGWRLGLLFPADNALYRERDVESAPLESGFRLVRGQAGHVLHLLDLGGRPGLALECRAAEPTDVSADFGWSSRRKDGSCGCVCAPPGFRSLVFLLLPSRTH